MHAAHAKRYWSFAALLAFVLVFLYSSNEIGRLWTTATSSPGDHHGRASQSTMALQDTYPPDIVYSDTVVF